MGSSNHGNGPVEAEKAEAATKKIFTAPGRGTKLTNMVRDVLSGRDRQT